jgi:hypothetical protein
MTIAPNAHENRHGRVDDSTGLRIVSDGTNPLLWDAQEHNGTQSNVLPWAGKVRVRALNSPSL